MTDSNDGDGPAVPYLPSIGRLLGFASRATSVLSERRLAIHGLTLQQWILLTALWRKDELTIGQLAEYCRVTEPTASSLVDRMEAKSLVLRERSKSDRRKVVVCLTSKGRDLSGLIGFYEEINDALLTGFSVSERRMIEDMLERIIANAQRASANDRSE